MRYTTTTAGRVVEVASPRTGTIDTYQIPPGVTPAAYGLRCAERARVTECLAAIHGHERTRATHRRHGPIMTPGPRRPPSAPTVALAHAAASAGQGHRPAVAGIR
jgi:hypothetical protein